MPNIITLFKNGWTFVSERIWQIRIGKVDKKQGFLLKNLRIFALSVKGFNEDNCLTKATALTFLYSLFYCPYFGIIICHSERHWIRKKFTR